MPPPKRKNDAARRVRRRERVAALYLQGKTQTEISRAVGVSQMTVSNDLVAVRKEWLASTLRDFDALQAEELAKLQHLEAEAWAEWDRSRRVGLGDPRYLDAVVRCIEARLKILGLFDPSPESASAFVVNWEAVRGS